jgi:hypothetical protein
MGGFPNDEAIYGVKPQEESRPATVVLDFGDGTPPFQIADDTVPESFAQSPVFFPPVRRAVTIARLRAIANMLEATA